MWKWEEVFQRRQLELKEIVCILLSSLSRNMLPRFLLVFKVSIREKKTSTKNHFIYFKSLTSVARSIQFFIRISISVWIFVKNIIIVDGMSSSSCNCILLFSFLVAFWLLLLHFRLKISADIFLSNRDGELTHKYAHTICFVCYSFMSAVYNSNCCFLCDSFFPPIASCSRLFFSVRKSFFAIVCAAASSSTLEILFFWILNKRQKYCHFVLNAHCSTPFKVFTTQFNLCVYAWNLRQYNLLSLIYMHLAFGFRRLFIFLSLLHWMHVMDFFGSFFVLTSLSPIFSPVGTLFGAMVFV